MNAPFDDDVKPRAATGHMPFAGHRTVATVWAQQAAARKRERERRPFTKAIEFGFEPDSLKVAK
jgi:predicted PhzF superfamily epimerase YddE/YHI9